MSDDEGLDLSGLLGFGDDRAAKRIESGDGRALEPFRWWHLLSSRKVFFLRLAAPEGGMTTYAVDIRLSGKQAGDEGKAHLYRNGRHQAASRLPAAFPVEGGVIEARLSAYGMRRIHYVTPGGEQQLVPHPKSAIGRRLNFDLQHPRAGRWVAVVSVVLLIVGVGVNVPQLIEAVSQVPAIAERFGSFESPIRLPLWLNISLGVGAAIASMERGLRMRYNALFDGLGN